MTANENVSKLVAELRCRANDINARDEDSCCMGEAADALESVAREKEDDVKDYNETLRLRRLENERLTTQLAAAEKREAAIKTAVRSIIDVMLGDGSDGAMLEQIDIICDAVLNEVAFLAADTDKAKGGPA